MQSGKRDNVKKEDEDEHKIERIWSAVDRRLDQDSNRRYFEQRLEGAEEAEEAKDPQEAEVRAIKAD